MICLVIYAIYYALIARQESVLSNKIFKVFRILLSEITSLNQRDIQYTTLIRATHKRFIPFIKPWNVNTELNVVANIQKLVFKGQGEGDTKWKGWAWNWLLVKLIIF